LLDLYRSNGQTDAADALAKKFPLPLTVIQPTEADDANGEKPFIACRSNQIGTKHRSPWTHRLYPDGSDFYEPTDDNHEDLRVLEEQMNQVWSAYTHLYYGHEAVSSVYLSPYDAGSFQGVWAIRKHCDSGSWDSWHVVTVESVHPSTRMCVYRVETTVLNLALPTLPSGQGTCTISASLSKETTKSIKVIPNLVNASHIENIGKLLEANEIDVRSSLERVHVPKTQELIDTMQKNEPKMPTQVNPLMGMIMGSDVLKKRLAKNNS
jgi:hypothetical protein